MDAFVFVVILSEEFLYEFIFMKTLCNFHRQQAAVMVITDFTRVREFINIKIDAIFINGITDKFVLLGHIVKGQLFTLQGASVNPFTKMIVIGRIGN